MSYLTTEEFERLFDLLVTGKPFLFKIGTIMSFRVFDIEEVV